MKSDNKKTGLLKERSKEINIFLLYSILFCIFTAGIFAVLIISHRSVMQFHDAYKQGAFRIIELKNVMRDIMEGKGFSFWSWHKGVGMDEPIENYVDPCSMVAALFPIRYLELGFTAAALLRMYLGGLCFVVLGREINLKREQALLGALLYTFSAGFMGLALRQSEHLVNAFLFPLLIVSVEKIYKNKSPILYILVVAYYMLIFIYFAYMSAIIVIIYILIRYFAYYDFSGIRDYLKSFSKFIKYGIVGAMLSAFSSIFSMFTLMRASTDSSNGTPGILFDSNHYLTLGEMILGTGATYDYSDIGLNIIVLLLLPISIKRISRKSTNAIMTLLLFFMLLIPFFCSMFNGFGYISFRWTYSLILFATLSAMEQLDINIIGDRRNIAVSLIGLCVITAWTIVFYSLGIIDISRTGRIFIPMQLLAGAMTIGLFMHISRQKKISKNAYIALIIIPFVSLTLGWSVGFSNNIESFARNASVYNNLEKSPLRVGRNIEDEGFYRIDSVDAISRHAELKFPSNENIKWGTNNIFYYDSRIPERLTKFSVEMGNSYGYARRVFYLSNGNRMGMDFLFGVRYFLGNDRKTGYTDSDNYAGYGFEKCGVIDGVDVYKNKYDAGLGYVVDKVISKSDFDTLYRLEKEQAAMQAAAVPDDQIIKCKYVEVIGPNQLDLDVNIVPFEVISTDGAQISEGKIKTSKSNASFVIRIEDAPECQLVLSFDKLLRNTKDGKAGASYELYAENGRVKKTVLNQNSRQGVQGLGNHSINMGYCKGPAEVKISLSSKGIYSFDSMDVYAMSTSNYDRHAEECIKTAYNVDKFNNREVEGTVDSKGGILFLSIPAYDNWDVYVDGEKTDKITGVDTTFMGAVVPPGRHNVTLKYNNRFVSIGLIISIIGMIMILAIATKQHKQRDRG